MKCEGKCPFCGNNEVEFVSSPPRDTGSPDGARGFQIECSTCGARGPACKTAHEANACWSAVAASGNRGDAFFPKS